MKSLTNPEKQRLQRALTTLIGNGNRFQDLGNFHGNPQNICKDGSGRGKMCCPHDPTNRPIFLPWHRLYMAQMEYELGEALPYWDWTEDGNVPDLWEGIRAPIQLGAVGSCSGGGGQFVTRSTSASINVTAQKKQVRDALDLTSDLTAFQNALNGPHGSIHFGMGGDMACLETAGYDPIFFLHHGNVDYLWAFWQEVARINGNSNPTIPRFDQPLEPYSNKVYNDNDRTFQKSRPQDTLDYRNNFCYQYDQLLHNNLTPQEFVYWNKNRNFCNPKPAQGNAAPVHAA